MLRKLIQVNLVVLSVAFAAFAQIIEEPKTINHGQKFEQAITTGEKHNYKFTASANQFTNIEVEQKGIDILIKLLTAEGKLIAEYDSPTGRAGTEETKAVLEKAGEYRLEISVVERSKVTGKYELNFSAQREANPGDVKRFEAIIAYQEGMKLRGQRTVATVKEAVLKFDKAAKLMEELGDKKQQGIALSEKGLSLQTITDYENAIPTYKAAIALYDEIKDYKNKATTLNNIAFIKARISEYQESLLYFHQSLETSKLTNNETNTVLPLINLATIYKAVGDLPRAVEYYNEALVLTKRNNMKNSEAAIMMNLGLIYAEVGEVQKGLDLHLEILPYYKSTRDDGGELNMLGYIADEYFSLGKYDEALNYFNQQLKQSLAANAGRNLVFAYFGLGKTYTRLGETEKALENLNNSKKYVNENKSDLVNILLWNGINQRNLGKLNEAKAELEKAIQIVESIRNRLSSQELRTAYFSKVNRRIYEVYVTILMDLYFQTKNDEYQTLAFEYAEKSKARSLLELLALSRVDIRQGVDTALLQEEKKIRKDLQEKAALLSRLTAAKTPEERLKEAQLNYSKAEESIQQIEGKIRSASPHYAAITQLQTVSFKEAQSLLDKETILLEYLLGEQKSFLWVIGKDSIQTIELPKKSEIESKTRKYYELLTSRNLKIKFETAEEKRQRIAKSDAELPKIANELSQILIAPIANLLTNKKLIVVADGALQYIPFAGLVNKNRFLIETNEIVYLPSTSTLSVLRRDSASKKTAQQTAIVLADPVFDVQDERFSLAKVKNNSKSNPVATRNIEFEDVTRSMETVEEGDISIPRLPFTRKEAETIAKLAPTNQVKVALDFASTKQLALSDELNQYRIVHFATHGLVNYKNPELSGLVFSLIDENGNPLNGFLRTDEVFNMKLAADLVVLSGCKTGLGKEIRGEGLVGLTRGLMYAGASRMMVSLWDVNDEATAELMSQFYKNLLSKKLKPAQSLREAQLTFLKDRRFSNPYYAMAFTIHGEF